MDSVITLGIGNLEVDWRKFLEFQDHSKLFLKKDIKPITYYEYDDDHVLDHYSVLPPVFVPASIRGCHHRPGVP